MAINRTKRRRYHRMLNDVRRIVAAADMFDSRTRRKVITKAIIFGQSCIWHARRRWRPMRGARQRRCHGERGRDHGRD